METITPATSQAPDWAAQASDTVEDLDEPPEPRIHMPAPSPFQRSAIRRPAYHEPSLLTKAFLGQSDEDDAIVAAPRSTKFNLQRRRSMVSNVSIASTADLTSDTGFTSPSRASTPSPPMPDISVLRLHDGFPDHKATALGHLTALRVQETVKEAPRKRLIQFACAAKPMPQPQQQAAAAPPMTKTTSEQGAPRRSCIKFACPARPASTQNTPSRSEQTANTESSKVESSTSNGGSTPTVIAPIPSRPSPVRRSSAKGTVTRPRFLRANSKDLIKDGSQFHEFASGTAREDDWIRHANLTTQTKKLTIYDTLTKENLIRRLAKEAEEEAELEEEEAEVAQDDDDDDEDEDDEDELDELDDINEEEELDEDEYGNDDSDGYHTDEETGFAESDDDEDDGDENMVLWTPSRAATIGPDSGMRMARRPSVNEQHSDSSTASKRRIRRSKARPIGPQAEAPDLPDSTDFVCGTLDEDRPVEDAYLSCLAARRNEKLRVIPQDIDPSFPASDLDEDDDDMYVPAHHDSDENVWMNGAMEDLHHDQDRSRGKRKGGHTSPRRLRSPPPKRHPSPAPKARGRSPKPLFDRHSPRRIRSPAPKAITTPSQTPRQGAHIKFNLAGRPGLTHTKSLPRSGAIFRHTKHHKGSKTNSGNDAHIRGAIDIVKGLEKKRQRRREKFYQKYCNRARRGQIPERKPLPGLGAERMKELGLLMAGKKDQGNYVLSF